MFGIDSLAYFDKKTIILNAGLLEGSCGRETTFDGFPKMLGPISLRICGRFIRISGGASHVFKYRYDFPNNSTIILQFLFLPIISVTHHYITFNNLIQANPGSILSLVYIPTIESTSNVVILVGQDLKEMWDQKYLIPPLNYLRIDTHDFKIFSYPKIK